MQSSLVAIALFALLGCAAAFAPSAVSPRLALRSAAVSRKGALTSVRMGAERLPPGPKGRGPFDANDTFELPDGRMYQPGDAATDGIYGSALESPLVLPDGLKAIAALGGLGFSVLVPFILIKVIGGF